MEHEDSTWFTFGTGSGETLPVKTRIIDHNFAFQTRGANTIANIFADAGRKRGRSFSFKGSYTTKSELGEIAYGHDCVRELLLPLEDGKPGLVIYRDCWHTWNGLSHYVRRRPRNQDTQKAIGETKIIERYKDFPDVVRYFCAEKVFFYDDDIKEDKSTDVKQNFNGTKDPMAALGGMM